MGTLQGHCTNPGWALLSAIVPRMFHCVWTLQFGSPCTNILLGRWASAIDRVCCPVYIKEHPFFCKPEESEKKVSVRQERISFTLKHPPPLGTVPGFIPPPSQRWPFWFRMPRLSPRNFHQFQAVEEWGSLVLTCLFFEVFRTSSPLFPRPREGWVSRDATL